MCAGVELMPPALKSERPYPFSQPKSHFYKLKISRGNLLDVNKHIGTYNANKHFYNRTLIQNDSICYEMDDKYSNETFST